MRAVIAGDGESRGELEQLIAALGLSGRVTLAGAISDEEMLDHYARCRAVCFTPIDEDYGFVTVEAFASRKGVMTCVDSGGPAELVRDGETGLVCEPTPAALAQALARVMDDVVLAERLGAAAAARAAAMTWPAAVKRSRDRLGDVSALSLSCNPATLPSCNFASRIIVWDIAASSNRGWPRRRPRRSSTTR